MTPTSEEALPSELVDATVGQSGDSGLSGVRASAPADIATTRDSQPVQPILPGYPKRCTSGVHAKNKHYR